MRTDFGPEALALIIADKTDISRKRVSEKPKDPDTVDNDPHLEVNLLGETKSLVLSEDMTVFTWNLKFTPGMSKEEQDSDPRYVEASAVQSDGLKARVSKDTHSLHTDHHIPHFDRWKSLFWTLYYERIILTVRAAFALYPDLKKFVIMVKDQSPANEKSKITFKRDCLAETFELQKIKYALHKKE